MLVYDVVEIRPFVYELRDKTSGEKVNLTNKLKDLEAQGCFDAKKK